MWPRSPAGVPERESIFKNSLHLDTQHCIPRCHTWVMVTVIPGEAVKNRNTHSTLGTFCFFVEKPFLNSLFEIFLRCAVRLRGTLPTLLSFISFLKVEMCGNYHLCHWRCHAYLQSHSCCPICYLSHALQYHGAWKYCKTQFYLL